MSNRKRNPRGRFTAEKTTAERLAAMVERQPNGCLFWNGPVDGSGYGRLRVAGRRSKIRAHRLAWELANGPIPNGLHVLHTCDVPGHPEDRSYRRCVEPRHLYLGTHRENMLDRNMRLRTARGARMGAAVFSEDQVRDIRRRLAEGQSQSAISRDFGVHTTTIWAIARGDTWGWLL